MLDTQQLDIELEVEMDLTPDIEVQTAEPVPIPHSGKINVDVITTVFAGVDGATANAQAKEQALPSQYPEAILQLTSNGNKYYGSFQRYSKQFVADGTTGIVRWPNSAIESTQRTIIDAWSGTHDSKRVNASARRSLTGRGAKPLSKANKLFKWSSGDAYIEARKQELRVRKGLVASSIDDMQQLSLQSKSPKPSPSQPSIDIAKLAESVVNNLNRAIETESNKFIQARIHKIKLHHSEAIKKQIHERKRHDHELHLQRLKLKEEQYEREIQASLAAQQKQTGFLGTLFGFTSSTTPQANLGQFPNSSSTSVDSILQIEAALAQLAQLKSKRFSFLPSGAIFGKGSTPEVSRSGETLDLPTTPLGTGSNLAAGSNLATNSPKNDSSPAASSKIPVEEELTLHHIPQEGNNDATGDEGDDDEEFEDFRSSVPPVLQVVTTPNEDTTTLFDISALVPESRAASPQIKQPLATHKFIPLNASGQSTTASNQNMAELMDIFASPTKTPEPTPNQAKFRPATPSTDNLLDL